MPRHTHGPGTRPTDMRQVHAERIRELLASGRAEDAKALHNSRVGQYAARRSMGRADVYSLDDLRAAKRELDLFSGDSGTDHGNAA